MTIFSTSTVEWKHVSDKFNLFYIVKSHKLFSFKTIKYFYRKTVFNKPMKINNFTCFSARFYDF